jgi:Fungal protein kinase
MRWTILDPGMASYAKLPTPVTPVKAKRLRRETLKTQQSDYKTKSAEVEKELRQELRGAIFVETPGFLDTFFSVPSAIVDRILAVAGTKSYHDGSKWTAFPKINATQHNYEKDLYKPFVDVANFITNECPTAPGFDLRWLSDPNRSPTSVDTKAADLEPDIVGVLGFLQVASPEAEVCLQLKRKPRELKPPKPPWRRVHVPMEVKRENVQWAAALQLFKYIRQVFHEFFDRRFVFGIVLARSNVTVYLADRSGILGSENFDMHEVSEFHSHRGTVAG